MSDRMLEVGQSLKSHTQSAFSSLLLYSYKLVIGLVFGLFFSIVILEFVGEPIEYGRLIHSAITISFVLLFFRMSKSWGFGKCSLFGLVFLLFCSLFRLYLTVAP